ncbi:MAG: altronate dehydratase, partial [Caldilineaceae bacterium]|nr:altronate dehydratase [Caldilineaceae bacterium]
MPHFYRFDEIARLPLPGDNVAIATQKLEAGVCLEYGGDTHCLSHTVLEGHRFAVQPIVAGEPLLSWELPFGVATRDIAPGEYVCNESMLSALAGRSVRLDLPSAANFEDRIEPYVLDEASFTPGDRLPQYAETRTFEGYRRPGTRGVGTRNTIVLLGVTSRAGSFVKQLEARTAHLAIDHARIDGIVAVAHTEGDAVAGGGLPNNLDMLLRTLAGFMVHPNVGAVLAVDYGLEAVTGAMLRDFMLANGYPLDDVLHQFFSLSGTFQANLEQAESIVSGWLDQVNNIQRTPESLAHLKIALQCGGSDAFSGISGNPL